MGSPLTICPTLVGSAVGDDEPVLVDPGKQSRIAVARPLPTPEMLRAGRNAVQWSVAVGNLVSAAVIISYSILTIGTTSLAGSDLAKIAGIAFGINSIPLFLRPPLSSMMTLMVLIVLSAAGICLPSSVAASVGSVLAAVGWLTLAKFAIRRPLRFPSYRFVFGALCICWVMCNEAWGLRNPLVTERLAVWGDLSHPDAVWQSSIVATILTYGTPSLGLDGVQYFSYHHATNFFIAGLAGLVGLPPLTAVLVVFPMTCLGWLITQMLNFSVWLGEVAKQRDSSFQNTNAKLLLLAIFFAGVFPDSMHQAAFLPRAYAQGENTVLAMGAMLSLASLNYYCFLSRRASLRIAAPLLAAVSVLLLSWLKGFTAHIALGFLWYIALRNFHRNKGLLVAAVLSTSCYLLTAPMFLGEVNSTFLYLQAFGFLRQWVDVNNWYIFVLVSCSWILLWCCVVFGSKQSASLAQFKENLSLAYLTKLECALLLAVICLGPFLVLGGRHSMNCFQYSHITQQLAICFILWELGGWRRGGEAAWRECRGRNLVLFILCLGGVYHGLTNSIGLTKEIVWRAIQDHGNSVMTPLGVDRSAGKPSMSALLRDGNVAGTLEGLRLNTSDASESLRRTTSLWSALKRVSRIPREEKQHALIYLARGNAFWKACHPAFEEQWDQQRYLGFFAVGLTGCAMLNGAPEEDLRGGKVVYGFGTYPPSRSLPSNTTDGQLLEEAVDKGASSLYIIEEKSSGVHTVRVVRRVGSRVSIEQL